MTGPDVPRMLSELEQLVTCESPSEDLDRLAECADLVAAIGTSHLRAAPERIEADGRVHLRWRFGDQPTVLLLGHYDTVWPLGSLLTHPWVNDGEVVRGPGCFDMKAGLVQIFHAVGALADPSGVVVLVTADEEIGSPTSQALIEAEARTVRAALVLEASGDGGAVKTQRKGTSMYTVAVTGRAAHAGLEPEKGVNAGIELAHQLLRVADLGEESTGTTVTPTTLRGGSTTNTVPASATVDVDVRVETIAEQERIDAVIRRLAPVHGEAVVTVTGGPNRPPLEADRSRELFALAQRIWTDLGYGELASIAVGGASDGNFTAGVGTPTLDGLGAVGGGAHADHEHVLVADLPRRTHLLTRLLTELSGASEAQASSAPDKSV